MGISEVFGHFHKFLIRDHETWFTGTLWVLSGVWKWHPWAKFVNVQVFVNFLENFPLDSHQTWFISLLELLLYVHVLKIGPREPNFGPPNESKFRFSNIMLKSFLWFHISLALYAHWSYFQRCVQYGPQRPNFWVILDSKLSQNSVLWSLSQKVFTGFTSVLLHMLILPVFSVVCWILASKAQFWDHLGPKNKPKSRPVVILSKRFHWFHTSIASHASLQVH